MEILSVVLNNFLFFFFFVGVVFVVTIFPPEGWQLDILISLSRCFLTKVANRLPMEHFRKFNILLSFLWSQKFPAKPCFLLIINVQHLFNAFQIFEKPVLCWFLCCRPACSSCLELITLWYALGNDCSRSFSTFTRAQQVGIRWQQGRGCFLGGLTTASRGLAPGELWAGEDAGHNKLKSELYFHKLLSLGHREFHAKYLQLTGHWALQHLLLLPLHPLLTHGMRSLWVLWRPFNPFRGRSPSNYKYVSPYSSEVELHLTAAFDVILTPTARDEYFIFIAQNWAIWDSQVTEFTIFWTKIHWQNNAQILHLFSSTCKSAGLFLHH